MQEKLDELSLEPENTGERMTTFTLILDIPIDDANDISIVSQTDKGTVFSFGVIGGTEGAYYDATANTVEMLEAGQYERVGDYLVRLDFTEAWEEALSLDIYTLDGQQLVKRLVDGGIATNYYADGNTIYYAYGIGYQDDEIQLWSCDLETLETTMLRTVSGSYPGELSPGHMSYVVEHKDPEGGYIFEHRELTF